MKSDNIVTDCDNTTLTLITGQVLDDCPHRVPVPGVRQGLQLPG